MHAFWQDIKHGIRKLSKTPSLTAVAVVTLALGIGASTGLFSMLNALVLRELPVTAPDKLVAFYTADQQGRFRGISVLQLKTLDREQKVFSSVYGRLYPDNSNIEVDGDIWPINLGRVTGRYYSVLGIRPYLGRLINPDDTGITTGAPSPVAVISYQIWRRLYAERRDVIGKTILIAKKPFTIIGVTPADFFGTQVGFALDVTIPITELVGGEDSARGPWCQQGVGRLLPGVSFENARSELEQIWSAVRVSAVPPALSPEQLARLGREEIRVERFPTNGYSYLRDQFAKPLYVLIAVSGLILLIACVNLAVLLLARSSARYREMAIRLALGASRLRIVRQMLTESVMISITGAVLGSGLAIWASGWLVSFWSHIPFNPPTVINSRPNFVAVVFAASVAILTGLLFGLAPAWYASNQKPAASLQGAPRIGDRRVRQIGKVLVCVQVALSLMLVMAGGVLVRNLERIRAISPGFNYHGIAFMQLQGDTGGNQDYGDTYYRNLVQGLSDLPGVESVSLSQMPPASGFGTTWRVQPNGGKGQTVIADSEIISPGFFKTLQIPIVKGRDFTWRDTESSPKVAILSESAANELHLKGGAVGDFLQISTEGARRTIQVIGIAADARLMDIRSSSTSTLYVPFLQQPKYWTNVEVRTMGAPRSVLRAGRQLVEQLGNQYVFNAETLESVVDGAIANERAMAFVSGFFSVMALLVAVVGLQGLTSYTVMQRTREIGIRMTVGATRANILGMIAREVMLLLSIGLSVGLMGALVVGRLLKVFLMGLTTADPAIIGAASLLLLMAGIAGCYFPARAAMMVEPVEAVRYE